MGSGLFVAHQVVLHPTLALSDMESVVNRQDRPAGVPKNRVDTMTM